MSRQLFLFHVFLVWALVAHAAGGGEARQPKGAVVGTDRHGDPLPPGAVARFGTVRLRQPGGTHFVAFSPDRKLLASLGNGSAISLWDVASGKLFGRLECGSPPRALAFAPGGRLLASGHKDRTIRLWDLTTGKEARRLSGHLGTVVCLAFSPDGRLLASGGHDENYQYEGPGRFARQVSGDTDRTIRLWDVASGKPVRELAGHTSAVTSLQFLQNGAGLLSGSNDGTMRLWDVPSGKLQRTLAPRGQVTPLCLGPGGLLARVSSPNEEGELRLWDLSTEGSVPWPGGMGRDMGLTAVSADGTLLAGVRDRIVYLYEAHTGRRLRRLGGAEDYSLNALAFSPDGKLLAAGDGGPHLRVWEVATGKELQARPGHQGAALFVRFLPDGKTVLSAGHDTAHLWEGATGRPLRRFEFRDGLWRAPSTDLDLSSDGRFLAVWGLFVPLSIWDVGSGSIRATINGTKLQHGAMRFSPDGKTLVVAYRRVLAHHRDPDVSTVRLLEVPTGKELHNFGKHPGSVRSLLFSEDGKHLIVSADAVHLWDLASKKQLPRFPKEAPALYASCPGGKYLLSGSGGLGLWKLATGNRLQLIQQFETSADGSDLVWAGAPLLALSPDSRLVATDTSSRRGPGVQLRELLTGKKLGRLSGRQGQVHDLAFSPDGRYLLSAGADGTVLVWDAAAAVRKHLARKVVLTAADLQRYWHDLGRTREGPAAVAGDRLVEAPRQSLPWLKEHLRPISEDGIDGLLADLDARSYARRQRAMAELYCRELAAQPALKRVLQGAPSLEARRRAEALLQKLAAPMTEPSVLRAWRSVAVLEQIGTAEARALLERLARGSPHARLTQDARAALRRWPLLPRVRLTADKPSPAP
jgi:WD40 repeat protein